MKFLRILALVAGAALLALPVASQTIPGGGGGGGSAPCSAFGTTTGTCLQGAGALGTPSSGNGSNLTSLNASSLASGTVPAAQMPALTGDITTSAGAVATTLATVNSNVGTFGSSTNCITETVNAKGLITAVSQTACAGGGGTGTPGGSTNDAQYNAGGGNFGGVTLGTGQGMLGVTSSAPTAKNVLLYGTQATSTGSGNVSISAGVPDEITTGSTSLAAARTWTLPCSTAQPFNGYRVHVGDAAGLINGNNNIVIAANASGCSDTIDGAANMTIGLAHAGVELEVISGGYHVIGDTLLQSTSAVSHNFVTNIDGNGIQHLAQPAVGDISGFGTGVGTALGVNVGSAGAPVLFNGAGGTPSSLTLTNATGLVPSSGLAATGTPTSSTCLLGNNTWGSCSAGSGTVTTLTAGTNITFSSGATCTTTCTINASGGGGSSTPSIPQGRLTLVSGTPVMVSNQTAKSTIYYDNYQGNLVPYYTGSADASDTIAGGEVSLTMATSGTGVTNASGVFDIWWVHGGTNRICVATNGSGGGWASDTGGSNTARGTGYSQVHNTRGYWTNVNSITHCYNGTSDYGSVSADQATYLGTIYTTGAGQTGVNLQPTAAAGGANNFLALWNAYNRVSAKATNAESTSTWNFSAVAGTWETLDVSNSNRISFIDGLGQSPVDATLGLAVVLPSSGGVECRTGINQDSTSATPANWGEGATSVTGNQITQTVAQNFFPAIGLHYYQAMQVSVNGTTCLAVGSSGREWLQLHAEY